MGLLVGETVCSLESRNLGGGIGADCTPNWLARSRDLRTAIGQTQYLDVLKGGGSGVGEGELGKRHVLSPVV